MSTLPVSRQQLLDLVKRAGFRSQQAFAEAVGLSGPKLTNVLKGARRAQTAEVQRMAAALRVPSYKVIDLLGMGSAPFEGIYKIDGFVGDAEQVVEYDGTSEELRLREIQVGFLFYGGNLMAIETDALSPRYLRHETIGVGLEYSVNLSDPPLGVDVVARLKTGAMVLKTLYSGSNQGRFSLLSPNGRLPPVLDVELDWAALVDFRLPSTARRK